MNLKRWKSTLLNLANGYSFPSSAALRQWWNTAPSFRAGLVKGIHFQGLTLRTPKWAFACLYPLPDWKYLWNLWHTNISFPYWKHTNCRQTKLLPVSVGNRGAASLLSLTKRLKSSRAIPSGLRKTSFFGLYLGFGFCVPIILSFVTSGVPGLPSSKISKTSAIFTLFVLCPTFWSDTCQHLRQECE